MNKRESVLSLLDKDKQQQHIPAAFFLHFDPTCHHGQAAIDKHLEYFRYTGMDFVKSLNKEQKITMYVLLSAALMIILYAITSYFAISHHLNNLKAF